MLGQNFKMKTPKAVTRVAHGTFLIHALSVGPGRAGTSNQTFNYWCMFHHHIHGIVLARRKHK